MKMWNFIWDEENFMWFQGRCCVSTCGNPNLYVKKDKQRSEHAKICNYMRKYWINRWRGKASICSIICGCVYNGLFCRLDVTPCQKLLALWAVTWRRPPSAEKPPHLHLSQKPRRAHSVSAACSCKCVCVRCHIKVRRSGETQAGRQISSYCWAPIRGSACLCGKAKCCRLRPVWALFFTWFTGVTAVTLGNDGPASTYMWERTGVLVTLQSDSFCVLWWEEGRKRSHTSERAGVKQIVLSDTETPEQSRNLPQALCIVSTTPVTIQTRLQCAQVWSQQLTSHENQYHWLDWCIMFEDPKRNLLSLLHSLESL